MLKNLTTPQKVVCIAYGLFFLALAVFSWVFIPFGQVKLVFGWMPMFYFWFGLWQVVMFLAFLYYYLAEGRYSE